jgi:hypothetical protein
MMQKANAFVSVNHFHPSVTSNLLTRVLLYEHFLSLCPQILDLGVYSNPLANYNAALNAAKNDLQWMF